MSALLPAAGTPDAPPRTSPVSQGTPLGAPPKRFAIFIAYNAERTLGEFWRTFPRDLFHRVILVDDASRDGTFALAQSLGISAYRNEVNRGYGGNLKRALDLALRQGADIIVDIHPDGEYKTSAIVPAVREIEQGAEFVLGNRFAGGRHPLKSGMFIWKVPVVMLLDGLCKMILRLPIDDYHQGFRVYTRSLLEKVNYNANANDFSFSAQLLAQAAFHRVKVRQVPVEVRYAGRKRGASLKNSMLYTVQTLGVLAAFLLAKMGVPIAIFHAPAKTS